MAEKTKKVVVKVTSSGLKPVLKDLRKLSTQTKKQHKIKIDVNKAHFKSSVSKALASLNTGGTRALKIKATINKSLFRNSILAQLRVIEARGLRLTAAVSVGKTGAVADRRERGGRQESRRGAEVGAISQVGTTGGIRQSIEIFKNMGTTFEGMERVFKKMIEIQGKSNRQMNLLNSNMEMLTRAVADMVGALVGKSAKARIMRQVQGASMARRNVHSGEGYLVEQQGPLRPGDKRLIGPGTGEQWSKEKNWNPKHAALRAKENRLAMHGSKSSMMSGIKRAEIEKNTAALLKNTAAENKNTTSTNKNTSKSKVNTSTGGGRPGSTRKRNQAVSGIPGRAGKEFANMASGEGGFVGMYAAIAAQLFAVGAAFRALRDSADMTILNKSMEAYGNATGSSLRLVTKSLQEAMGMAIDYKDAAQATMLATAAGFGKDQIVQMGEAAKLTGQALGRNMGDALDRITKGIIKQEPELLDELGIILRLEDASNRYADAQEISGRKLTTYEKQQAVLVDTLTQVEQKFGALAGKVDVNSWDLISSRILEMGRGLGELLNMFMGPVVSLIAGSGTLLTAAFVGLVTYLTRQAIPALFGTASAADKLKEIAADRTAMGDEKRPGLGSQADIHASARKARTKYWSQTDGRQTRGGARSMTAANIAGIKDLTKNIKDRDAFAQLDARKDYLEGSQGSGMVASMKQGATSTRDYTRALRDNSKVYMKEMGKQIRYSGKFGKVMGRMGMIGAGAFRGIGTAVKSSTFALELFGKGLMAAMPMIMMLVMAYQLLSGVIESAMKATGLFTTSNDELHASLSSLGSELDKQAIKQNEYNLLLASSTFSLDELALAAERAGNRQMALSDAITAPLQELEAFNLTASSLDKWWDNDIFDKATDSLKNLAGQLKKTGEMQNFLNSSKAKELSITESSLLNPSDKGTEATERTFKALNSFFKSQAKAAKNYESNIKDLSSAFKGLKKETDAFLTTYIPTTPFDKMLVRLKEIDELFDKVYDKGEFADIDIAAGRGKTAKLLQDFDISDTEQDSGYFSRFFGTDAFKRSQAEKEKQIKLFFDGDQKLIKGISDKTWKAYSEAFRDIKAKMPEGLDLFNPLAKIGSEDMGPATEQRIKDQLSMYSKWHEIPPSVKQVLVKRLSFLGMTDSEAKAVEDGIKSLSEAHILIYGKELAGLDADAPITAYKDLKAAHDAFFKEIERRQQASIKSKAIQASLKDEAAQYKKIKDNVQAQVNATSLLNSSRVEERYQLEQQIVLAKKMYTEAEDKIRLDAQVYALNAKIRKLNLDMKSEQIEGQKEYIKLLEKEWNLNKELVSSKAGYLSVLKEAQGLSGMDMAIFDAEIEKRTKLNDLVIKYGKAAVEAAENTYEHNKLAIKPLEGLNKLQKQQLTQTEELLAIEFARIELKKQSAVLAAKSEEIQDQISLNEELNDSRMEYNDLLKTAGVLSETGLEKTKLTFELEKLSSEYYSERYRVSKQISNLEGERTGFATDLNKRIDSQISKLKKTQGINSKIYAQSVKNKVTEQQINEVLRERTEILETYDDFYEKSEANLEAKLELAKGYNAVSLTIDKRELKGHKAAFKIYKIRQKAQELNLLQLTDAEDIKIRNKKLDILDIERQTTRLELQKEYLDSMKEEHELRKTIFKDQGIFSNPSEFGRLFSDEMHYRFEEFNDNFRDNVTFAADLWETAFLEPIDRMAENLKNDQGIYGEGGYDEFWNDTWRGIGDQLIDQGAAEMKKALMSTYEKDKIAEAENKVIEQMKLGNVPMVEAVERGNDLLNDISGKVDPSKMGRSDLHPGFIRVAKSLDDFTKFMGDEFNPLIRDNFKGAVVTFEIAVLKFARLFDTQLGKSYSGATGYTRGNFSDYNASDKTMDKLMSNAEADQKQMESQYAIEKFIDNLGFGMMDKVISLGNDGKTAKEVIDEFVEVITKVPEVIKVTTESMKRTLETTVPITKTGSTLPWREEESNYLDNFVNTFEAYKQLKMDDISGATRTKDREMWGARTDVKRGTADYQSYLQELKVLQEKSKVTEGILETEKAITKELEKRTPEGRKNSFIDSFASGGHISGPGGPKEDKIPAWLSNGEYVVNAASTKKHEPLIRAINEDKVPAFANGGKFDWMKSLQKSAVDNSIQRLSDKMNVNNILKNDDAMSKTTSGKMHKAGPNFKTFKGASWWVNPQGQKVRNVGKPYGIWQKGMNWKLNPVTGDTPEVRKYKLKNINKGSGKGFGKGLKGFGPSMFLPPALMEQLLMPQGMPSLELNGGGFISDLLFGKQAQANPILYAAGTKFLTWGGNLLGKNAGKGLGNLGSKTSGIFGKPTTKSLFTRNRGKGSPYDWITKGANESGKAYNKRVSDFRGKIQNPTRQKLENKIWRMESGGKEVIPRFDKFGNRQYALGGKVSDQIKGNWPMTNPWFGDPERMSNEDALDWIKDTKADNWEKGQAAIGKLNPFWGGIDAMDWNKSIQKKYGNVRARQISTYKGWSSDKNIMAETNAIRLAGGGKLQDPRDNGRNGDTLLAHINGNEAGLLKQLGGAGTANPMTGLPQFYGADTKIASLEEALTEAAMRELFDGLNVEINRQRDAATQNSLKISASIDKLFDSNGDWIAKGNNLLDEGLKKDAENARINLDILQKQYTEEREKFNVLVGLNEDGKISDQERKDLSEESRNLLENIEAALGGRGSLAKKLTDIDKKTGKEALLRTGAINEGATKEQQDAFIANYNKSNKDAVEYKTRQDIALAEKQYRMFELNNTKMGKVFSEFGVELSSIHAVAGASFKMALGEFFRTGKFNVKTLVGSFLSGVGNMFADAATKSLMGMMGFANGGIAEGGFRAFANGGKVTSPTLGLLGEGKYNEAVVPLPDGKSIPVIGGSGGGETTNNVSISINMEQGTAQSSSSGGDGAGSSDDMALLGDMIAGQVQQLLMDEKRPGGILSDI